jgi:hypothetical protein
MPVTKTAAMLRDGTFSGMLEGHGAVKHGAVMDVISVTEAA